MKGVPDTNYEILSVFLSLKPTVVKIVEPANRVDPNKVAHDEPCYLVLHCLPCCL